MTQAKKPIINYKINLRCLCGNEGSISIPISPIQCNKCGRTILRPSYIEEFPDRDYFINMALKPQVLQEPGIISIIHQSWDTEEVTFLKNIEKYMKDYGLDPKNTWGVQHLTRFISATLGQPPLKFRNFMFCPYKEALKIEDVYDANLHTKIQIGLAVQHKIAEALKRTYRGTEEYLSHKIVPYYDTNGNKIGEINIIYSIDYYSKNKILAEIKTLRWKTYLRKEERKLKWNKFSIENLKKENFRYWTQSMLYGFIEDFSPVKLIIVDVNTGEIIHDNVDVNKRTVQKWLNTAIPMLKNIKEKKWGMERASFWCNTCPRSIKGEYDEEGNLVSGRPGIDICPAFYHLPKSLRAEYR